MKYSIICFLDIEESYISIFRKPVTITLFSDNIGRTFACEIRDQFFKDLKDHFSPELFQSVISTYKTPEHILPSLFMSIYYTNSLDIPVGGNIELPKKDSDILRADVAVLLCEGFQKIKFPTVV
jgi:hypothetical protein